MEQLLLADASTDQADRAELDRGARLAERQQTIAVVVDAAVGLAQQCRSIEVGDKNATAGLFDDQAFRHQHAERLPDDVAADRKTLAELALARKRGAKLIV